MLTCSVCRTVGTVLAGITLLVGVATWAAGSDVTSNGVASEKTKVTLQEQLESGLRARRPQEFAYIKRIVTLVEQGVLPRKLVLETFDWARQKHRKYPLPYFQFGLRKRAELLGINID
ncbi:MAG: hypothetical protein R3E01_15270 [Pirellulaceae bacterium]